MATGAPAAPVATAGPTGAPGAPAATAATVVAEETAGPKYDIGNCIETLFNMAKESDENIKKILLALKKYYDKGTLTDPVKSVFLKLAQQYGIIEKPKGTLARIFGRGGARKTSKKLKSKSKRNSKYRKTLQD